MSARKDASRRNIAGLARELAPRAMEKLEQLLSSDQPSVALDAAKHILDRAIGKPIAMTADVTDRLDEFTDDELNAAIAELQAQIASAQSDADEASLPGRAH